MTLIEAVVIAAFVSYIAEILHVLSLLFILGKKKKSLPALYLPVAFFSFVSELIEIESDNNTLTGNYTRSREVQVNQLPLGTWWLFSIMSQWHWPGCDCLWEKREMWIWEMLDISAAQPSGVFSVTSVCRWQECHQRKCQRGCQTWVMQQPNPASCWLDCEVFILFWPFHIHTEGQKYIYCMQNK